jgi:hypothetical protein
MDYVERTALLGELVGAALRHPVFQGRASALPVGKIRQAVEDELAEKDIAVTVIDVNPSPGGATNTCEIVWQPLGGGKFQRLWFTIAPRPHSMI